MKTIDLIKILQDYPLFKENDVAKILNKNPDYIKTLLHRLKERKLIYSIERGKYTCYDDILLFASHIYVPSYISLWTAIRYYNLTEQMPKIIFIMTPKSRKPLKFNDISIKFVKTKYFFGFKKERYRDFDIFIAEPEKAVIDSLISKKIPLDEIEKAIKMKQIDIKKLLDYAIKIKNKSLIKRLGFILEEKNIKCERLKKFVDANYTVLDLMLGKQGRKNKKWRVIDNRK
ncbi:MAG: hypothetical protein KJ623_04525 [Nanoarchaeota archaeon]|nr:hypothetical protein [Nanoarchaeota archaeon]MBU0962544.1 hypothetical protein [Nanoarchaeota archaeon]